MSWLLYQCLAVLGVLLFVIQDCQSLFLRHVDTGKCIAASDELVYVNPNHAFPYYVVMTDNCLDNKAEFCYRDTQLLHNIEKNGTLVSTTNNYYKYRWAVYKGVAASSRNYQLRAEHRLKQTSTGSLFFYHIDPVCAEPDSLNFYLLRKTYCNKTQQHFTFGSITAYNDKMENVHCSPIQRMMVVSADYGEFNNNGEFNPNASIDTQCSKLTNCQGKSLCSGNRSCELTMNNNLLPSQYCSDTSKQIYTKYNCVDTYSSSAIITAPNIRLTSLNAGYIEIKHGLNWRRVVEESWDKNRQKMLCLHLGFEEVNGNRIETRKLGSVQQIVTGDLICYNTPPSGTSCCVHLEPSTSPASTMIPYVRCKMCNYPLLLNANAFPDSVFSGIGDPSNKYNDARITKGGWCPSMSGSSNLLLDLQKEYHITQAVVIADKEQTKWSSSYSLKYSHDTSYKNTAPILGNQNGYQASRTNLDIYNVRYMKIESTGNRNFCLRIELCGEVQTPAPVSNINVSPSQYSAHVTWQISASTQDSSYITKIIIYLNGEERTNISRRTEVTIDRLLPYTMYTVGIETQDGSSQKSNKVTKTFKTNETEPVNPVAISYFSLSVSLPKPELFIKDVMVVVQIAPKTPTPVEDIQTNDLKPYQNNTQHPYITAHFKADILPLTFVIGDGKEYIFKNTRYYNHPLKQNSSYIVFLRLFETKDSYYSTEWSSSVKTRIKRLGPPLNVTLKSRGKTSLEVSWKAPDKSFQNSELTGYQVCFYTSDTTPECLVVKSSKVLSLTLYNLQPSTKYFVTVSAITKASYGEKSLEVSKITNGEAVNPLTMCYYSLSLDIPKQKDYIRGVMVIVENSMSSSARSENLGASDLKPYQRNIKGPYVTAYIKTDVLPLTFVIGDGREYNSEEEKYFNQPLKQNSKFIVFLRFFENQNSYYSTEWSGNVTTTMQPPVKSQDAKQSNREEIRIDLIIPLVFLVAYFFLSLGVIIYQRRLIQTKNGQHCHKFGASKQEQQIKKFDSLSNIKRTKDIKASPELHDEAVYELPDSDCTKQNQAKPEIFTGQESSTYTSLKDNEESESVYQSLQPEKENIAAAMEYQNPAFTCSGN